MFCMIIKTHIYKEIIVWILFNMLILYAAKLYRFLDKALFLQCDCILCLL
jgi:hypothetical protein